MAEFTHLHVHTQYSILDGAASVEGLLEKAKKDGMEAMAITDHGNMYGVMSFYSQAQKMGIKPIIGIETYVAANGMHEKSKKEDRSGYHLILLAKNKIGYHNLVKLSSIAFKDGFYYTPRVDKDLLRKYSEGLIAMSACLGGEIPKAIMNHSIEKIDEVIDEYVDIFGEDFYLEVQNHGLPEQKAVQDAMVILAQKHNLKIVATNDVHFVEPDDAESHNILICLNTGKDADDEEGMHYSGNEYLKSPEEMAELFAEIPDAIKNTQEIVEKIENYDITRKVLLPEFPLPEGFDNEDVYLEHLTYEGAKNRFKEITDEIKERLDYELGVVKDMGFAGYFLIVQDFINEARKMDVIVGPGRGSAAGSAIAYCVGITNIDPIAYNLLFERFLKPDRISMPDVDIDFDDIGREKVLDYVIKKYGEEKVAQIVTFGTMAPRSSIRDVARVLKLPLPDADRLAKLIPKGPNISLSKSYKDVKELADEIKDGDILTKKTLRIAEKLEGSIRQSGIHACGVIIGRNDLINHVPLARAKDSKLMVTQFDGKYVESAGMLKMDFLGLKTLSIIRNAIENIYRRHEIKINIDEIPLDDEKTFELFQMGRTVGIFQFESEGMRKSLRDLRPTNLEDLIAMNALYRPGPMDFIPSFINRKQGKEKIEYPHPFLEKLLKPTYGIMVYQEQIMQTAQIMGGFSLGKADILRRAMGKKKMDVMQEQREIFINGAKEKGIDEKNASEVFEIMTEFAKYGFNRSHAAAYSLIAYQTAYLKAHYTAEYMAAVLTNNLSDISDITFFIEATKRSNIAVLGPNINESDLNFIVNKKGEIRFGLGAIKGVGEAAVSDIVNERHANGNFKNIFDFAKRVNLRSVNKRSFEALAYAGAFDDFPDSHRAQYFFKEDENDTVFIEKIIKHAALCQEKENSTQQSLFGDDSEVEIADPTLPDCEPWSKLEQLKSEKDVIGFYVSGHPLDDFKLEIDTFCNSTINMISGDLMKLKNKEFKFAGLVTSVEHKLTKNGKAFGSFFLEDYSDSIKLTLFGEDYLENKKFFQEPGRFLFIRAKVQSRYYDENQYEVKVNKITLLSDMLEKGAKNLTIHLSLDSISKEFNDRLSLVFKKHKGKCHLKVKIKDDEGDLIDVPSNTIKVDCGQVYKILEDEFGVKCLIS
ncbi:MAG: DNA polymerase III subunit alpha [Saprospiraceae bacterium]|nr:DNA polymerase III subunit alpha [Saprospiraceae bacterium]